MSVDRAIAIVPWVHFKEPRTIHEIQLTPYERGRKPFGEDTQEQTVLDTMPGSFVERGDQSITHGTLLHKSDAAPTILLEEDDVEEMLLLGELIAIAGLSDRDFFWPGATGYVNREHYRLFTRSYSTGDNRFVRVLSRRRDGPTTNVIELEARRIHRPVQCLPPIETPLDVQLLSALLAAYSAAPPSWPHYRDAITYVLENDDAV